MLLNKAVSEETVTVGNVRRYPHLQGILSERHAYRLYKKSTQPKHPMRGVFCVPPVPYTTSNSPHICRGCDKQ